MTEKQFREKERNAAVKKTVKKHKRKKKAGAIALLLILASLFIAAAVTFSAFYFFKIENITVEGNSCYTAEQIIEVSKIENGESLLFLNTNRISEKLQKELPYISFVEFKRELPSGIRIIVTETYEEVCFYKDGGFYSADADKKLLNFYMTRPEGLTVVIASEDDELKVGERYVPKNDTQATMLDSILKYSSTTEDKVSIINTTDQYKAYFIIEDRVVVELGSSAYFERKLEFIEKTLKPMSERGHNYLDLSDWSPDNNVAHSDEKDINSYIICN